MSTFTTIQSCRVCGGSELEVVLDLGEQALTGRFPRQATEQITKGPLCVVRCQPSAGGCGLVQLRETFDPGEMYGETYGYRSGLNLSMVRHLQGKADRIRQTVGDIRGLVLDIGSNDCTFLKAMDKPNVELIGIDPAAAKFAEYYPSHVRSLAKFFSAASFHSLAGNRKAAVVTSFAMFYDLEAPIEFAREIASILEDDGIWVFEQSYLPMMLTHNSYDTVCHEHSEYYALRQILFILKNAGLKAVDIEFNDVNGGSFSVMATHIASQRPECLQKMGTALEREDKCGVTGGEAWAPFRDRIDRERESLISFLKVENQRGRLTLGYGASTKGNVVLQYCGVTPALLPAIAEVNPDKFGAFTPGTVIPIISERDARAMKPDSFIVFPWHFRDNIIAREEAFIRDGGALVFPLPTLNVVEAPARELVTSVG